MCNLCSESIKGKITSKEIARAFLETNMEQRHLDEFVEILRQQGILDDFILEYLQIEGVTNER